jgi:P-type Cu2+ transporter
MEHNHSCCEVKDKEPEIRVSETHTDIGTYICPMHPEIVSEKPGMCPICGMALVKGKSSKQKHTSGDKHQGHKTDSFFKKFYVTLALTIPILFYSDVFMIAFNWNAPRFPGVDFVILLLGSVIFFYGGWIFLTSAYREIQARMPGMMTLISLAIISAYIFSVYVTIFGGAHTLFWELATLIAVMLVGHFIEMKSVQGAKGALRELAKLIPDTAEVMRGGNIVKISTNELILGDMMVVRPGAKIPADGKIIKGESELDESIITGESHSILKKEGDKVIAGSINGDGSLTVEVTEIGEKTFLAGIMRLVAEAESSKSRLQILSDRAALYLTFIAIIAGVITFVTWLLLGKDLFFAVERVVAIFVITCPHALGLAIPLVASISTTMGAKNGLLVRKRLSLEMARNIDVVLFDKTGTLTKGEFGISEIIPYGNNQINDVIQLASSVNSHSEHSIGKAIVSYAKEKNIQIVSINNFERIAGRGAKATIDSFEVIAGNMSLVLEQNIVLEKDYQEKITSLEREGKTVIHVIKNKNIIGSIALADVIRPESKEAIIKLKEMGIKSAMITGDASDVAGWVAKELGLDEYFAKVLPHEKKEKVELLQSKGLRVAMVGDGVNDAPALTQSDLGIAIGAGTNVAVESAGIVLVKNDPRDIVKIIRLSKFTYQKMIQNLFWATGYNIIALPIAAGVLYSQGIMLNPAVAAVFMSLSTVIVAVNAVMLRKKKL